MKLNPFHGTGLFPCPQHVFQRVQKETSAIKWVTDIFKKNVSRVLIFMLVLQQSMLSYGRSAMVV